MEKLDQTAAIRPDMVSTYETPAVRHSKELTRAIVEDETVRYFHDVGGHRLLRHDEEIDLARKVQQGLRAQRRHVAGEHVEDLQEILEAASAARDTLIRHNLRLVVSIARKFRASNVPLLDLVQEGNIGLMTAVERYNPELGYRFSTYATFWIRQSIGRAIANMSRTIRIPVHMHDLMSKIRRTRATFEMQAGRQPSYEELAKILDVSIDQIVLAESSEAQVASLDKPVSADGTSTIGDILPDPHSDQVVEHAMNSAIHDQILKSLNTLTSRERKLVTLRYGLDGDVPKTLGELATILEISRERVRQIEKRALEKLRNSKTLSSIDLIGVN